MEKEPTPMPGDLEHITRQLPDAMRSNVQGFDARSGEGVSEKLVDQIEMIGEEEAAGFKPPEHPEVSAGMRYLHCSRTIHQLVTDRNRAVGIFLAVASLLLTASGAIFHANPAGDLMVPLQKVQKWCLPVAFGTSTLLALFVAFLLIRTRVGLIYEVAKMNALLGLPLGRVSRLSPLSIHFILQALISTLGGLSAALFTIFLLHYANPEPTGAGWIGAGVGLVTAALLMVLYVATVLHTTSDKRLQGIGKQ